MVHVTLRLICAWKVLLLVWLYDWWCIILFLLILQGFLQGELVAEAHKGLKKRCIACSEFLMQNMENLDALVSLIMIHNTLLFLIIQLLTRIFHQLRHWWEERGRLLYRGYRFVLNFSSINFDSTVTISYYKILQALLEKTDELSKRISSKK